MIKTHLDQTAAIEEAVSCVCSVCHSFCIVWRHLSTVSYIMGVRRCKSSMVNDDRIVKGVREIVGSVSSLCSTINFWFFQQLLVMFRNDLSIRELKKRASTFGAENAGSKLSCAIQTALK